MAAMIAASGTQCGTISLERGAGQAGIVHVMKLRSA
tara:strand:+ start:44830 stop:44937 length:108 start_codon:yes stop_codon:yes gene_type:complete